MREFFRGAGLLLAGFAWWRRRPRAMALGLLPAAIVAVLLVAALTALGASLTPLTTAVTPFAEGWVPFWRDLLRFGVGAAAFGGALVLAVVSFTALTLVVGEPFYERIWRTVERDLGGDVPDGDNPFWRSVVDGASLVGRGILVAILAALMGLIPVVGTVLGFLTGVLLTGWLLADELSSRSLAARGLTRDERRALLRAHRARALGFGVATQLFFLVPLGAVAVMPVAVAGSTALARSLLGEDADAAR
ncbi:EI24 domain-containing protein [Microbacterium sp. SS28]|uniref:EI24 domain-containing protein n=1 Tax=Microbacterium sp. SS28 TaxID=2919948 RepID=UPI001FA96047|nr:EI24 domain-containing protein [Microbacterium sp. SS28]